MKKLLTTVLAGVAMLVTATTASAYSISGNDIGGLDQYIAGEVLGNSGDAVEVSWVNQELNAYFGVTTYNFTVGDLTKYDTEDGAGWVETDQFDPERVVAFALETAPAFYFVKTGNLQSGPYDTFLFANNASLDWAVLDLDTSFGAGYEIRGIGKFSHNGELGSAPVPEPGTIILLGAGFLGLAAYGRKRIKK